MIHYVYYCVLTESHRKSPHVEIPKKPSCLIPFITAFSRLHLCNSLQFWTRLLIITPLGFFSTKINQKNLLFVQTSARIGRKCIVMLKYLRQSCTTFKVILFLHRLYDPLFDLCTSFWYISVIPCLFLFSYIYFKFTIKRVVLKLPISNVLWTVFVDV